MRVKHIVTSTQNEVDSLFNIAMTSCLIVYPTVEEQSAAIHAAKSVFQTQLDTIIYEAYDVGRKLAEMKADYKDTESYVV